MQLSTRDHTALEGLLEGCSRFRDWDRGGGDVWIADRVVDVWGVIKSCAFTERRLAASVGVHFWLHELSTNRMFAVVL